MFFKSKPNLLTGEKARIEFHLQQIAQCIGMDRMKLPVISRRELLSWSETKTPQGMIVAVGAHLNHDVSGVGFALDPQQLQQCGGGG